MSIEFLEAKAPMTAKCIIRDVLKANKVGSSDRERERAVSRIVGAMYGEGYVIVHYKDVRPEKA